MEKKNQMTFNILDGIQKLYNNYEFHIKQNINTMENYIQVHLTHIGIKII